MLIGLTGAVMFLSLTAYFPKVGSLALSSTRKPTYHLRPIFSSYPDVPAKRRFSSWSSDGGDAHYQRSGGDPPLGRSTRPTLQDRRAKGENRKFGENVAHRGDYGRGKNFRSEFRFERDGDQKVPAYGYFDGDHLYGIAPIRLAISSARRNITELLVQEGMDLASKKDEKAASDILRLAKEKSVPIREFSKHDLNMLTENRPHQGFVLRAAPLKFKQLDTMPSTDKFQCVLALDEVWDPQNFGALLRTSHFLGVDAVVVCAKNSAPLSPTVSKASAGAMEIMEVFSTENMMKFLDKSKDNGWQVLGTALGDTSISLDAVPLEAPTILVLGNEGHGVRTNILRRCTHLVKIAGSGQSGDVDSLNVSVTGGILLHHILKGRKLAE